MATILSQASAFIQFSYKFSHFCGIPASFVACDLFVPFVQVIYIISLTYVK